MKRYENIDVLRGIAIIIIIIYHCFAITAPTLTSICYINKLVGYGGEIGVTLFFVLSGFGIECSILNKEKSSEYEWKDFMKRRMRRIIPQYYICLIIMLLLTDWASLIINKQGILHIVTHFSFTHNLLPTTHGSINGAMWSLATIVQFYCISLLLHKFIKKNHNISLVCAIIITIVMKMIIYYFIANHFEGNGVYYFVYGRQLITALDNFVIGMVIGNFCTIKDIEVQWYNWFFVILNVGITVALVIWIDQRGLYTNTIWGWCWHSMLALVMGAIIYFFVQCPSLLRGIKKIFLFVSQIEYGMYIWHMVLIYNLLNKSQFVKAISERSFSLFTFGILAVTVFSGYLSTRIVDKSV